MEASRPSGKRVYILRHGQGTHNKPSWGGANPYSKVDPRLTPLGLEQAAGVLTRAPQLADAELLVVSPLARAVQTAAAAFGQRPAMRTILTPLHSERWSANCDEG